MSAGVLDSLLDLVLPVVCFGCGRPGRVLCPICAAPDLQPIRTLSGVAVGGEIPVVAAARYEGAVRAALLCYKERGRRDLAGPLGRLLACAVRALFPPPGPPPGLLLASVPSTSRARRARGGDHVVRLARRAGTVTSPLRLRRAVLDSAGLGVRQRAANLREAMGARPPRLAGAPVVIVDDIITTGATIAEAARALRGAGWQVLGAATVAATPRRHSVPVATHSGS